MRSCLVLSRNIYQITQGDAVILCVAEPEPILSTSK
ncbi:hypothetical protein FOFC_20901 [Fusarium oxysporum]|nr:hypothetical protein FOFC_20901 [Fusarium oxysporum]